jgi:hypothetical protein
MTTKTSPMIKRKLIGILAALALFHAQAASVQGVPLGPNGGSSGVGSSYTFSTGLTNTAGTVTLGDANLTCSAGVIGLTPTWNNSGTVFTQGNRAKEFWTIGRSSESSKSTDSPIGGLRWRLRSRKSGRFTKQSSS